ncbi:hypothetical protein C8J57DRAFT_1233724 [Mycena rebaudengoi]|nr:hypothetical protein C8J57DRAFT_1233724 [Mycena rebaudengoi]
MLPVVEMLPLRELLVDFEDLFATPTLPTIDPTLPMFRELTHLRVQNVSEECSFTEFPALTHLCFNAQVGGGALVASTLEHCSKLRILVGVFWGQRSIELWDQSTDDLFSPPVNTITTPLTSLDLTAQQTELSCAGTSRQLSSQSAAGPDVHCPQGRDYADWQAGARGESGMWACAERFTTKRRRGEIQPASRCWIEDSDLIQ